MTLAAHTVVRERHFHGAVYGLRARANEEKAIQPSGREFGNFARKLKCLRMRSSKRHRVIKRFQLRVHGFGDLRAAMPRRDTEEARRRIDQLVAVLRPQMHAVALDEHAWLRLKFFVRRKRHPIVVECVRVLRMSRSVGKLVVSVAHKTSCI